MTLRDHIAVRIVDPRRLSNYQRRRSNGFMDV